MFITAIIPNYNHAPYLQERLESVLQQERQPDEVIILDDCSTDNSVAIIEAFIAAHPTVQFVRNKVNSGSTFAQWQKGIAIAKGDYIWMAESDDVAAPGLLAALADRIITQPTAVLAYCQSERMNNQGVITGSWLAYTASLPDSSVFNTSFLMDGTRYLQQFLIHRNTIPNASAVLFSKKAFEQVGGVPKGFTTNGDWLLWIRFALVGAIAYVNTPYNKFRYHDSSVIAKAHAATSNAYKERYDYTMRMQLVPFLQGQALAPIKKINNYYIGLDMGQKGLHCLQLRQWLKGWYWVIRGSVYGGFKTGFIKKAIGIA